MDQGLRTALLELDCASLGDVDKSIRVMQPALRPLQLGHKLVGPARTVRCHEDFLTVIKAIDESVAGEVLVIDTGGSQRAVLGELFSIEARRRGLAGIVVDGPVRDTKMLRRLAIPVYARSACPVAGTTTTLAQTQCVIECGGVTVRPGDIVVGDDDGVLVADAAAFDRMLDGAAAIERTETVMRERMLAGHGLIEMLNYRAHAAAISDGRDSKLAFVLPPADEEQ